MMQRGLHVGLAAWINEQQNWNGFAVYPTDPSPISLVDLGAIRNASDMAKAAEFARLVNFVPSQGQSADIFNSSDVLWQVHKEILGRMDHATSPWSDAEQQEYQTARSLLYVSDGSGMQTPSAKYLLYEEMRNAYYDIQTAGGSADEIAQALANWALVGFKQEIENALETITRLMSRSTRNQAENERLALDDLRLARHGELTFAPTYFAPISAISQDTWLSVTVSFAEIDRAVGNSPARSAWRNYVANRSGTVTFEYIVLNCLRPWFTSNLYQADDWRIQSDEQAISQGNGSDGLLPGYVDAVYLVNVKDVNARPTMSVRPVELVPITYVVNARPLLVSNQPKEVASAEPRLGVVGSRLSAKSAVSVSTAVSNVGMPAYRESMVLSAPETAGARLAASGRYERLSAAKINNRFILANALLAGNGSQVNTPPAQPGPSHVYVAGFGCKRIPLAPNPNPNYQW